MTVAVSVVPEDAPAWVVDAVRAGGGMIVPLAEAEALVWANPWQPDLLGRVVAGAPQLRWVHLPFAGVEPYIDLMTPDRVWTCGKGVYAEPVAEHALALALAGLRCLPTRITAREWGAHDGRSLFDRPVTIVGGGGITEWLVRLLAPFRCAVTVVRRQDVPFAGADRVLTVDHLHEALPGAAVVFLALALTPATTGIIGAAELAAMDAEAWLVNVARGRHVVTDDLVAALRDGVIGGAALDVTDPEPLPPGHPLWELPNCIITPHTANTVPMAQPHLAARLTQNVAAYAAGRPLIGTVDLAAGY
ncbi:MAG: hydroxyacid dehydrogenase [Acidobacteria bacterium]|nr:hydroxyacid dehydrogenase [Acidobacteriota bacterium]